MTLEYFNLLIFFTIILLVTLFLLILTWILSRKQYLNEKTSLYECGFEPFNDSRQTVNLNFYNIALLFLLFDVEIILLVPGLSSLGAFTFIGRFWLISFLSVLVLGFLYEFNTNILILYKKENILGMDSGLYCSLYCMFFLDVKLEVNPSIRLTDLLIQSSLVHTSKLLLLLLSFFFIVIVALGWAYKDTISTSCKNGWITFIALPFIIKINSIILIIAGIISAIDYFRNYYIALPWAIVNWYLINDDLSFCKRQYNLMVEYRGVVGYFESYFNWFYSHFQYQGGDIFLNVISCTDDNVGEKIRCVERVPYCRQHGWPLRVRTFLNAAHFYKYLLDDPYLLTDNPWTMNLILHPRGSKLDSVEVWKFFSDALDICLMIDGHPRARDPNVVELGWQAMLDSFYFISLLG